MHNDIPRDLILIHTMSTLHCERQRGLLLSLMAGDIWIRIEIARAIQSRDSPQSAHRQ